MTKIRCGGWAFDSWTFESNSNLNLSFWPHNIKHQVKNTIYGSPTLTSMSLRPIWIPPVRDRDRQHEWNLGIQGYGLPMSAPFPMLRAPWARMPMNIYSPHQVSYEYRYLHILFKLILANHRVSCQRLARRRSLCAHRRATKMMFPFPSNMPPFHLRV